MEETTRLRAEGRIKEKEPVVVGESVFRREDGSCTYFYNETDGVRVTVVDAALGSRFYDFQKTLDV